MDIEMSPRKILVALLVTIGFLLFANIMGIVSVKGFGHDTVYGLVRLFNFNREGNLPTFYSSLQLIVCSSILAIIGAKHSSDGARYIPWYALAVIFLILAIDETAQIHEEFTAPFQTTFKLEGLQFVAWVIPYGIGVLALLIAFSRFLLRLPRKSRRQFIASGAIYVLGAIGFEYLGARHAAFYGSGNVGFSMYTTCEELLEMLGAALFIHALLVYISNEFKHLRATIRV